MRQLNNIPSLINGEYQANFVINDIELHIPPTAISVHKEGLEYAWKTLRSKVSTKIASGNGTYHVQVSITFAPDSLILLHRLISQVRNNPFVAIQNSFIAGSIADTHEVSAQINYFTVFGFNINNHPSSPGAFLVELDLRYFNYKPFGNSLSYKKDHVNRVITGTTVKDYVHGVFPQYKKEPNLEKPLLKREIQIKNSNATSRNVEGKKDLSSFKSNSFKGTGLTLDPRNSSAYKRYSNFLQLKYLNESFGINVIKDSEKPEDYVPNEVYISERLYNLFQGTILNSKKTLESETVGLHELSLYNTEGNLIVDEELLNFRRDLIHAILLSGLNTRIITKEYRSLTLGGNFLFRYRKTLRKGIKKGMNEAEQNKIIQENRRKIFDLFADQESKIDPTRDKRTEEELNNLYVRKIDLECDSSRDLRLVIDPSSRNLINQNPKKFSPPGNKVSLEIWQGNRYLVRNIDSWSVDNPLFPVMTIVASKIKFNGSNVELTYNKDGNERKIIYKNINTFQNITDWLVSKGDVEFPAGTIVGFFNLANSFELECYGELINELTKNLTGKILLNRDAVQLESSAEREKRISTRIKDKTYLTIADKPNVDAIKALIDEEGFSQYQYRSGLENVFQKALILSFDSNLFEEDVENITGKKTPRVNQDSFPKFEQDITNVSCSLRNIISSIPILGYAYPTHQFLGSIEPTFQFNFIGHTNVGDGLPPKIKELENIRAHTAYMAKNFPQIPDAANIIVESLLTKLVGSFKYYENDEKVVSYNEKDQGVIRDIKPRFLISSTDTFTIEGSPGTVGLNFRFSESKSYDEEELRAVKSSEISEDYIGRYASLLQQGGIQIGRDPATPSYNRTSYSQAKYVPNFWNTKHFSSKGFYAKSKGHLRKRIKTDGVEKVLIGDIDKNAFDFCKDYLDPLQDFLNIYSKHRWFGSDSDQNKKFNVIPFSTLDREFEGKSRATASNHFTGGAADIKITEMHVTEAAAIIELLEEKRFFNDSIGKRTGKPNRRRPLGIGVYGATASEEGETYTFFDNTVVTTRVGWMGRTTNPSRVMSTKSRENGFIHLDANFIVTHENKNGSSWSTRDSRRRWGGKEGADKFINAESFWGTEINNLKRIIKNSFDKAFKEYFDQETTTGLFFSGNSYEIDTKGLFKFENFTENQKIDIERDHIAGQIGDIYRDKDNIKFIVLHHGGHNAEFLKRTWQGTTTSSHFGISLEKDGSIRVSQMVDIARQTNHSADFNLQSIGIDFALSPDIRNAERYGLRIIDNPGVSGPKKILEFPTKMIEAAAQLISEIHRIVNGGLGPKPTMLPVDTNTTPNFTTREMTLNEIISGGYSVINHSNINTKGKFDAEYVSPRLVEAFTRIQSINEGTEEDAIIDDEDANEGEDAASTENGRKEDTRESASIEIYKFKSTNPRDFIKFLQENKEILGLSEIDISKSLITTYKERAGRVKLAKSKYNFEITQNNTNGKYEIKFFPPKGEEKLTSDQEAVIKALQRYYSETLLVNIDTSVTRSETFDVYVGTGDDLGMGPQTPSIRIGGNFKSKSIFISGSELNAKVAQQEAFAKAKSTNAKLLKGFTELASLMLTEPYLYTDSKKEFIEEMQFIQKELYGFPVLPAYYNSIEKLFTYLSTVEISNFADMQRGIANRDRKIEQSADTGAAIGSGLVFTGQLLAAIASGPIGWGAGTMLLLEGLFVIHALWTDLSKDSKEQLKRLRHAMGLFVGNLREKESFIEYMKYYNDNKKIILGEKVLVSEAGSKKIGDFLSEIGSADHVHPGINDYIKPIYTEISIFENFSKIAGELDANSRAKNLIRRSLKDSKDLIDDEGNIDRHLANFALADSLTVDGIKHYLKFLFTFPAINQNWDPTDEENYSDVVLSEKNNQDIIEYKYNDKFENGDVFYWPNTERPQIKFEANSNLFFNKKLYDHKRFPDLLTYQLNNENGLAKYFNEVIGKEELKKQNRVKLAYLKRLLTVILEENMVLNPEVVEKSKDPVLLKVLDGSSVFELLEDNAYPDIDLPQDPANPYSNSNLSPCFYYNDQNDFLEKMVEGTKPKESFAAKKILDSSVEFQKGLRAGIFTGPDRRIDTEGQKIIEAIVDSSEILRTTSDFLVSGEEDNKRSIYVTPIKIGLFNNDASTSAKQINETAPTEIRASAEIATIKNGAAALKRMTDNALEETNSQINNEFDKNKREFNRLSSAFGSNLGFKVSDEFIKQINDSGDAELKRTIGVSPDQSYSNNSIMDLSEDSSKNIYKLKTIKNAFPTFRLYLIEEDEIYTDRLTAFDDFFYYNSVISFNVHNSRELSSSVATIQLQNIAGVLDGTKKKILRDTDLDPNLEEDKTKQEGNFIDSIVLRPGVTVQLRAGYESNTNNLDVLISGKITDINYAQNNTICNITVQSFGDELTALRKGNGSKDSNQASVFYSTHQLLGSMLMSDELKHFGRSKVGAVFQIGEYKDFSLDLDLYKKESSFNFSLSRTFFDWVRDNTFGIGIGIGLLTFGGGALKYAAKTKFLKGIAGWYKTGTGWGFSTMRGFGKVINFGLKPISWLNPFGVSKRAQKLIIDAAKNLEAKAIASGPVTVPTSYVNTFEDAIEYLIKAKGFGGLTNIAAGRQLEHTFAGSISKLLTPTGMSSWEINRIAHGNVVGTVVGLYKAIAPKFGLSGTSELSEEFLKQLIIKQKGFGALGLSGLAPSVMSKTWLGTKLGADVLINGYMSMRLPLSIGMKGFAIAALLSGVDIIIDSAKYLYYSMIGSFIEDKNKLKKKKYLSPQDDNIFAPHPHQYMKNIPQVSYSYLGSLLSGFEEFREDIFMTSAEIVNQATWGLINITNNEKLKELKVNPFKLIDKRLDVSKYENPFVVSGQTIWEILHECTLRHPGYIYGVRPYGNSLEYRVFFGVPNQRYWSKKISNNEIRKLNKIFSSLKGLKDADLLTESDIKIIFPKEYALYKSLNNDDNGIKQHFTEKAYEYFIKKTKERFVPFRQFHLVSSKRNLISNNIIVSSHNMINAVSVNYINNMPGTKQDAKSSGGTEGLNATDGSWSPHLSKYGDRIETLRFRANRNIGMNNLKEKTVSSRNIVGPSNAVRYGIGELLYGCRKMYEGSLTILGDTKINPWDVVILHDDITNMYGPVEVCSVTHTLSFETGFITDVEVNALVTSNEELTHPMISQTLVYETRARIFDEYNNLNALGDTESERKETVRKIVEEELDRLIEEELAKNAGVIRRMGGVGLSVDIPGIPYGKKQKVIDFITKMTLKRYKDGEPDFLNDLVPADAKIPQELTNLLEDAGLLSAGISGTYLVGEGLRRRLTASGGLNIVGGGKGLAAMGLFFAASVALSRSGDLINRSLSSSYSSGDLGKNMFRQHIMSRMEHGNLIQLYPLVKDGLPLVTGGFEEVDETEKWNNMLGYIYNNASSAVKGYVKRQAELKAYGKRVLEAYDEGELTSLKSSITIKLAKFGNLIGLNDTASLLGYMYMEEN